MYESPEYHKMTVHLRHWESVRRYVDLARTFRSMTYGGDLVLETEPSHVNMGAHRVELSDSLRKDALAFLADRCEETAAKMMNESPLQIDIRAACKV